MSGGSSFRDRLRKRLGGPPKDRRPEPGNVTGPSFDAARLRARLERTLQRQSRRRADAREDQRADARFSNAPPPLDLESRSNAGGTYRERVVEIPLATFWGGLPLGRARDVVPERLATWSADPALREVRPEHAAFLDTETTSLSGGAGTIVFLIGIGVLSATHLRVHQVFLDRPGDEPGALERLRELLHGIHWLVSFHGKSFDRHRIHARFALHGTRSSLLGMPHLDLLHVGRRLWGHGLERTRLKDFERELLGFERVDDLPGAACPQAWFDHVRGSASPIGKVFEHNLVDIVSLAGLTARLTEYPGASTWEWLVHAEALQRSGHDEDARRALVRLRTGMLAEEPSVDLLERCGRLAQRLEQTDVARAAWMRLAEGGHVGGCIALAKHFEHAHGDAVEALRWCRLAETRESEPTRLRELEARRNRLLGKIARARS